MKLLDVIRISRRTKLKQLSDIDKTDEVLVDFINLAVLDLYRRFTFKTHEAVISLKAAVTDYSLAGADENVSMPANSEVLQITSAYDENRRIGINDDVDDFGIYTLDYLTIQVPVTEDAAFISILYKPYPQDITYSVDGSGNTIDATIELPKGAIDCITNYLGYLCYDSVDAGSGDSYLQKYEMACAKLVEDGIVPQETYNIDVTSKGYV